MTDNRSAKGVKVKALLARKRNEAIEMHSIDENGDRFHVLLRPKDFRSEKYQQKKAGDIYEVMITTIPAGVYKELFRKMIESDLSINKYLYEILQLRPDQIKIHRRHN